MLTASRVAFAQEDNPEPSLESAGPGDATQEGDAGSPKNAATQEAPPAAPTHVQVFSVGNAPTPTSLERTLGPALRSNFNLRFSRLARFEPEDVFRSRPGSLTRIFVWVDTTANGKTQVYFANRDGTRYLVRELEHSEPLNEMDREALAQTIEWSLQALSDGTVGMTRAEAEALLAKPQLEESPPEAEPPDPIEPKHSWRSKEHGWLPEVALLYGWVPHSTELVATQGLRVRLGADHLTKARQVGLYASAASFFPQRHAASGVALELQTVGLRLGARFLMLGLARHSGIGFRMSMGMDFVSVSPEALDWDRYEAARKSSNTVPLLDAGFVWQIRAQDGVRLEANVGVEADFLRVNYDVSTFDGMVLLVSRWLVRPSASLGLALF